MALHGVATLHIIQCAPELVLGQAGRRRVPGQDRQRNRTRCLRVVYLQEASCREEDVRIGTPSLGIVMLDRYERFSFYFCTFGMEIEVDGVFKPAKQLISVVKYPPKLIRELKEQRKADHEQANTFRGKAMRDLPGGILRARVQGGCEREELKCAERPSESMLRMLLGIRRRHGHYQ